MKSVITENREKYLERREFYKSFGYDIEAERRFILEKSLLVHENILEVGTGKGYFAVELAKKGYKLTSIDISVEDQKIAVLNAEYHKLEKQIEFRIENAERLSFPNESFNTVFSVNSVHHMDNAFLIIDEMLRVISLKGKIIISDFSKEGMELIDKIHASEGKKHEVGKTSLADISGYLSNKSFKIEKYRSEFQEVLVARNNKT
ncbi:MAG: hypothetical protein A2297_08075 [Elusimicrobia bacterium RIFOXYB2_FULL_48_7]|nr:MAG: hypothetical protein A2297_08075 [Elusimicrobia bacterium RIFOXYB2_FULL_48_7]